MSVSRRVSYNQLETLWEFLNSNKDIAMGYNKSCQARDKSRKLWMEVTNNLNSLVGGAIKGSKGWTAYWIDYKGKLKRKCAAICLSHSRTGGGPSDLMSLTEIEKKYLNILGEDFGLGLPGIQVNPFDETDNQLVLIALSFYATGSYQRPLGDIAAHSVSQQTVSAVVKQITQSLNLPYFRKKYIKFPLTDAERRENMFKFYNKFGMAGVLGCIDGTHVATKRPVEHEERFYCRKNYHSLNVQLICNSDMEIISVDASQGGATHDAFIWVNHPLKHHIKQFNGMWLLGDSGYPLRKGMMTPVVNAPPNTPEAHYNYYHIRTRNVVERTIGILKARFRCLLVHKVLHYEPHVAACIVNACVVLHNICNRANISIQEMTAEEMTQEQHLQPHFRSHVTENSAEVAGSTYGSELQEGVSTRSQLISHLWTLNG